MGQQQLLLIILGVIVVGIAIAVGLTLFTAQSIQANKDAIINDINNIAAYCYQYRIRPKSMAGGQGSYENCSLPPKLRDNENAKYEIVATATDVTITAHSKQNETDGTVTVKLTSEGTLDPNSWQFGPYFQSE